MTAERRVPEVLFDGVEPKYVKNIPAEEPKFDSSQDQHQQQKVRLSDGPNGDNPEVAVVERMVLTKFEGDIDTDPNAVAIERIVMEQGEVTQHFIRE